ncbi:MAG: hypothetical protein A3F09_04305 [Chlamydiae bacterium RIFCSPHIGHO2_12_FULL_49_11]|nr:MAG: hypothetical protein A3F09_04305 [Chlamydiae bacterium RIFCSPHIGHO2_12_FULL_49_11]
MIESWLKDSHYPKAAFGKLFCLGETQTGPFQIGGMRFGPRKNAMWDSFPASGFFYPREATTLAALPPETPLRFTAKTNLSSSFFALFDAFKESSQLQKAVISHVTVLEPVLAKDLLGHLYHRNGRFFAYMPDENHIFCGNSPELLFEREGTRYIVEAVAGTCRIGNEPLLMQSLKDREEFQYVLDFLVERTGGKPEFHTPQIKHAGNVSHLYNRVVFEGAGSDDAWISRLHPTPALAGIPQKEATEWLFRNEPHDRGWYGAPFGIRSDAKTTLAVAIRSFLLTPDALYAFSGAGCTQKSTPQLEWEEIMLKVFQGGLHGNPCPTR